MKKIVLEYFSKFSKKDCEIFEFMHSDVRLCDWNIDVSGIKKVKAEYENIWNNLNEIEIAILNIDIIDKTAYCTIQISANELNESLNVIDVITIKDSLIESVFAYRR